EDLDDKGPPTSNVLPGGGISWVLLAIIGPTSLEFYEDSNNGGRVIGDPTGGVATGGASSSASTSNSSPGSSLGSS
ncbi:hypothetical protein Tco_1034194, partial [Tanacetum coccineum]